MAYTKFDKTATIAASGTTSGAVDLGDEILVALVLPASFTGTSLTFTVAPTFGGTYQSLRDGLGNAVTITVAQGQTIRLNPADWAGVKCFKIVSGSSEGSARTITLGTRQIA